MPEQKNPQGDEHLEEAHDNEDVVELEIKLEIVVNVEGSHLDVCIKRLVPLRKE